MRIFKFLLIVFLSFHLTGFAQNNIDSKAIQWADSVFKTLSPDQRIAQLMVLRMSTYDFKTKTTTFFDQQLEEAVKKYNIGGICLFQGDPEKQAIIINRLQGLAKTPIMVCMDAEWGLGMRMFDSVQSLPHQMMLGAVQDADIVYQYGKLVANQCKRMGINVNYAPVVDINNNPDNPVINDRSFGEDKYKVALYGIQYMKGLQESGVMACAKHFPGHGDVSVDSHLDLPVIKKTMSQLDSLELYPFKEIFKAGVASVMVAHLYIPAIDNTPNRATSLSRKNINGLLRNDLHFNGLTFTDALEMQGVKKYFPVGDASVQSLIAGNDMLCLPGDIETNMTKINEAIDNGLLTREELDNHCKKVLVAKYLYGGGQFHTIDLQHLSSDLNQGIPEMKRLVAENAITVLAKKDDSFFPLDLGADSSSIAYVGIGLTEENAFAKKMKQDYHAAAFYFNYKQDTATIHQLTDSIIKKYNKVVIGIHAYNRTPQNNFGISKAAIQMVNTLQQKTSAICFAFGNPYAIRNFLPANNLVACYDDDEITQLTAIHLLEGKISAKGKLPVSIGAFYNFGKGINTGLRVLPKGNPDEQGMDIVQLNQLDTIALDAIHQQAMPGCVILVAKGGKIVYHKAFGHYNYDQKEPVSKGSVYDLASVTKIAATTLAVMKLFDEGKIDLHGRLGDYLPNVKGTNKEQLLIENILLHQAGLVPFIRFFEETLSKEGIPLTKYYSTQSNDSFNTRVAQNLYLRRDWQDSIFQKILQSPLGAPEKYLYSDNDFIFLGKVVEKISGLPLNEYVKINFYAPLGLHSTGFLPRTYLPLDIIVPTEKEKTFRTQLIRGDVHDPGAAMMGGVAGHAGLFSNAYDLAIVMQLLLNGGSMNGKVYLKKSTVELFTGYHAKDSRRGYGFDKPEKDNQTRAEPYPCISASPLSFGHSGYTGIWAWADPSNELIFIFLSNRVTPWGGENMKLSNLNIRPKMLENVYKSFKN